MSLDKDKSWRKIAVNDEHLPNPDRKTERAALAYNSYNNIYLIVTDSKCTAAKFRDAVKELGSGTLINAIFLDGIGSA